jgi:hypothetical protein
MTTTHWCQVSAVAAIRLVAVTTSACHGGQPYANRTFEVAPNRSSTEVWTALADALNQSGYTIEEKDVERKIVVTNWKVSLSPVAGDGRRQKLRVQMTTGPAGVVVELRIGEDINTNRSDPMVEAAAIWEPAQPNPAAMAEIEVHVKSRLKIGSDEGDLSFRTGPADSPNPTPKRTVPPSFGR